jgi:type VI secretion system protein ImpL
MKLNKGILIALVLLIAWLVLSWLSGSWLHLSGPRVWVLRLGMALIGLIGFCGYLVLQRSRARTAQGAGPAPAAASDIDYVFSEASLRLKSSPLLKGRRLDTLPAIFILGEPGAAKTSILAHSGLEPELLGGHAYQDNLVAPTKVLNLWLARQHMFVDPAGKLLADPQGRRDLFRRLAPIGLKSVLGFATAPSRAAALAVSCDSLLEQGAAENLASKARAFHAMLVELSQEIGSSLPVYVLFTKVDRIPYFRDYVDKLSESETAEVFGAVVPVQATQTGVYAEEQGRRLADLFQTLCWSLAEKRTLFLSREHDRSKLPNIYEFPREFAKLNALLLRFLVDVCRPGQLRTGPFLRGFYFTGVRPVVIGDIVASRVREPVQTPATADAGATRVFSRPQTSAPLLETPQSFSRRVPQWVFLSHLFSDLILIDKSTPGIAQGSVKVSFWRRLVLGGAITFAVLLCILWAVSFLRNRALIDDAAEAAQRLPVQKLSSTELASTDSFRQLENVRQSLSQLRQYESDGPPVLMRWGLYSGERVQPPLRQIYYASFHNMLLAPIQERLVAVCSNPPKSNDIGNYRQVYDALKAYLITTSHPDKSTRDFLILVLVDNYANGRSIDAERAELAKKQLAFYADDLTRGNPYPHLSRPNEDAVSSARLYLNQFGYTQRVYRVMLSDASKQNPSLVFNEKFPGSADVVSNAYRVEGAFTKEGFAAFQKGLQNPDRYFTAEDWVLGPASGIPANKAELAQELQSLYRDDFVKAWRNYLDATSVLPYRNLPDAANKLGRITGNQSPLLAALCLASSNTAVPDKSVANLFQPPQTVTPPGCLDRYASPANAPYMDALTKLQISVGQVAQSATNDAAKTQAIADAGQASAVAQQITRSFPVDHEGDVTAKTTSLLLAPVKSVDRLIQALGPAEANGQAKILCAQLQPLLVKYPFASRSGIDASLPEVANLLRQPDGTLWMAYNQNFQKLMIRQGSGFAPVPGQTVSLRPSFLSWFGRAATVSDALFRNGAPAPSFTFALRPVPSEDVESVTLEINGQSATFGKAGSNFQQFTWPGSVQGVKLQVRFTGGSAFNFQTGPGGLWAIFHWLDLAERLQYQGSTYTFENTVRTGAGPVTIPPNQHPATVKFVLDPMGSPVRPGFFSGLSPCVSTAVQ